MKLGMFLVIAMVCNLFSAVLFPAIIFGERGDIDSERAMTFEDTSYNGANKGYMENSQIIVNEDGKVMAKNQEQELESLANINDDQKSTNSLSDSFSFIDWLSTGFSKLVNFFKFFVAFNILLFEMPDPFGFLIGTMYSLMYTFSFVAFIAGRS